MGPRHLRRSPVPLSLVRRIRWRIPVAVRRICPACRAKTHPDSFVPGPVALLSRLSSGVTYRVCYACGWKGASLSGH